MHISEKRRPYKDADGKEILLPVSMSSYDSSDCYDWDVLVKLVKKNQDPTISAALVLGLAHENKSIRKALETAIRQNNVTEDDLYNNSARSFINTHVSYIAEEPCNWNMPSAVALDAMYEQSATRPHPQADAAFVRGFIDTELSALPFEIDAGALREYVSSGYQMKHETQTVQLPDGSYGHAQCRHMSL